MARVPITTMTINKVFESLPRAFACASAFFVSLIVNSSQMTQAELLPCRVSETASLQ